MVVWIGCLGYEFCLFEMVGEGGYCFCCEVEVIGCEFWGGVFGE